MTRWSQVPLRPEGLGGYHFPTHANVKVDHNMIHVTLTYEGRTVPETCAIAELHLVKHLVRFSLNARLTAITLSADNVLIHLGELEVSNLRTHAKRLMSNGAVAPILGSLTRKEVASA